MAKPMFDAEALISMFESATAQQGAQLQKATTDATLAALQGRELTLKNIKGALKAVADAASAGAARNPGAGIDPVRGDGTYDKIYSKWIGDKPSG